MNIRYIRTLSGPNIYNHKPVLLMALDLEELSETPSDQLPVFVDCLLRLLPGLHEHGCSLRKPGGFVERLQRGTYLGHIIEHVALELTEPVGIRVSYGKTVSTDEPSVYNVVVEYTAEHAMRYLLETAVELVSALLKGKSFSLHERLAEAKRIVARTELGPSTKAIVEAAERQGIPWTRLNEANLVRFGYGKHSTYIQATVSSHTSQIAVDIAQDKHLTKSLLRNAAIPVPRGCIVHTAGEAVAALTDLGPPVVVKPLNGNQGKGCSMNLTTAAQVTEAFDLAAAISAQVLVEEMYLGNDYRVVVVNGKMVAASERMPAHVVGDGEQTIAALIEKENQNPLRGDGHEKSLTRIVIDSIMQAYLRRCHLSLESIPAPGQIVFLREAANLSTGGTARDVTDRVHPTIVQLCERATRSIGLDICGIDLIAPDIAAPLNGCGGIIEVNAGPGIRMHHFPTHGHSRDVGAAIIDMLYPAPTSGRIPIFSITGTNGKTTVTRMISHILAATGQTVGMTTTDGIWIGGRCITEGDNSGPQSARIVLADPAVEVAVLETARGGIARRGLGYDWADIAILTNIHEDHIGQDGITSIDDLVHVKSLVAERVREGGTLILNADNEPTARLMEIPRVRKTPKQLIYFSLHDHHLLIKRHVTAGGIAYMVKNGWIVEAAGTAEQPLVEIAAIPVTLQGVAEFQVANALAAVAACRAHGVPRETIAGALQKFGSIENNVGRGNLYKVGRGYVLLDYGHNADAFAAIGRLAARLPEYRVTGVLDVPGDRADWVIAKAGRVAARVFAQVIIREPQDLRGRRKGEAASLLAQAVQEEVPTCDCRVILDEQEAVETALRELQDGDLVVLFYDELASVLGALQQYGATPAIALPAREAHPEAFYNTRTEVSFSFS